MNALADGRQRRRARRAELLDDPAGPGQRHHAPARCRERLRLILSELGTGLAGRPDDLAEVLERAHPGLRETSRVLRILGDQNHVIERFIVDADTVVQELEQNKKDVARWVTASADAAEVTATRSAELQADVREAPRLPRRAAPDDARPRQRRRRADAAAGRPAEGGARPPRVLPPARPVLRGLATGDRVARRVVEGGHEGLPARRRGGRRSCSALSKDAPGFAKPLRQFLETMDDRERAIESDERAKAGAPPEPDPTAIPDDANFRGLGPEGGFTGLESIWNYFYWQTLSINMFDDVAHIVRLGLTVSEGKCSQDLEPPARERGGAGDLRHVQPVDRTAPARHQRARLHDRRALEASSSDSDGGDTGGSRTSRQHGRPTAAPGELEAPPDAGQARPVGAQCRRSRRSCASLIERLSPQKRRPMTWTSALPQLPSSGDPQASPETLLDFLLAP